MGSSPVSICDARQLVIGKSNGDLSSRETTEEEDYAVLFSGEEEEMEGEWCGENRFCFYFVKQFAYDDPEIKAKIDEADNEIYNCNSERIHIANSLKAKRVKSFLLFVDFLWSQVVLKLCDFVGLGGEIVSGEFDNGSRS